MIRDYEVGDKVLLSISSDAYVPDGLKKWDGCVFRISKIVRIGHGRSKVAAHSGIYYELSNCVSDAGVPYGVVKEWLMPVRETR